jgi:outer membrane protein assembly complex protein YaeT
VITYAVDRGRQRRLAGVAFSGNRYFSTALLHERIRLLPARTFDRGRFSQRLLAEDAAGIRELYLANGFLSASVTPALEERYAGREQDIFVRFLVVEGQQTRVAELSIVGNQALDVETLFNAANSTPGQPFSEFNVAGDRDNILATYFNEGFPAARFEWEQRPAAQPGRVRLTYRLVEGPQVRVRDVLLSGYQFTRQHVIARELLLDPPEPLRQRNVVETQRRLYNLGVFRRVQLAPQNPAGTEPEKTMVVLVEEAKRTTVAYGGGIEFQRFGDRNDPVARGFRASPRGLLEVSRSNFAGRAHTVSLKARASSLQGRALASYAAPNFLGHRQWNLLVTGLADKSVDVNTFTSQRYEAGWQLEHRISDSTSFLYRYSFRRVLVDPDSLRIDPQQIPLFSQPTRISGFGLSWIRDRRDDPAEARSGTFNTFDLSLAQKTLGSSATFFRFFTQNSTFHPLPRRLVFARSLRFGFQQPFHDTLADEIPLPERFFSGGGNTLRGFGLNQAGPRDPVTGFPVGGLALLVLNNELRFPLRLPRLGEQVGGAVFYDAGNAFSRLSQMTFRVTPRSPTELNYFSHTIGIGFRYATPIGPVRLDLGYQLNAAQFAVDDGMGSQRFLRVPRFQFFFNIGSIF